MCDKNPKCILISGHESQCGEIVSTPYLDIGDGKARKITIEDGEVKEEIIGTS